MNNDTPAPPLPLTPPSSAPLPPAPSRGRRFWAHPLVRCTLFVLLSALLAAVSGGLLSGVLFLLHHRPGHHRFLAATLGESILAGSVLLAFWLMVRFVDRRPWATAGFSSDKLAAGLGGGFLLGAGMVALGVLALNLLGMYHIAAVVPSVLVLAPLLTYLAVAAFEEIFFRGYLFQTLESRWGSGAALAATSLLFGLAHLANPLPGASLGMRLAGPLQICLEAGLPMGAAYLLTRRMWLPIGIHWAWDYFEGPIFGCPDSGTHDPHTLLHAALSGPALWTGGPFGPEAGLVFLIVGTGVGAALLRAAIITGRWQPRPHRER